MEHVIANCCLHAQLHIRSGIVADTEKIDNFITAHVHLHENTNVCNYFMFIDLPIQGSSDSGSSWFTSVSIELCDSSTKKNKHIMTEQSSILNVQSDSNKRPKLFMPA